MLEFAFSQMLFGHDQITKHLKLLHKYDVRYLEIRGYPPRVDYHDPKYISKLARALKKYKVAVHSWHLPFNGLDISAPDKALRQESLVQAKASIDALVAVSGRYAVLHPGAGYSQIPKLRSEKERIARDSIGELAGYCAERGVKLAIELMLPGIVGDRVDFLLETVAAVGGTRVGICFDSSHANMVGDPLQLLRAIGPHLCTVHLSDNHGVRDEHNMPFDGNINWLLLLDVLAEIGYHEALLFEVNAHQMAPEAALVQLLKLYHSMTDKDA